MSDQNETPLHFAHDAINEAVTHYFENQLSDSQEIVDAATYLTELISTTQLWLFFTEGTQEHIQSLFIQDISKVNIIMTITTIFNQRINAGNDRYLEYIRTLATSCTVNGLQGESSLLPKEHSNRMQSFEEAVSMLRCNPHLVMLLTMLMYMDAGVVAAPLGFVKGG